MRYALVSVALLSLAAGGCSSVQKPTNTLYAAGERAVVGPLVYSVTDTETAQQLGDDPKNPRAAQERFYLIKLSITNSSSDEQPIPTMTLVDDAGKNYTELSD